jgi:hypothetical protein
MDSAHRGQRIGEVLDDVSHGHDMEGLLWPEILDGALNDAVAQAPADRLDA